MTEFQANITDALSSLVGLRMSLTAYAGNMREFGFDEPGARDLATLGAWQLHIQCPWRITRGDVLFTGFHDWYETEDGWSDRAGDDSWDPGKGGSLQQAKLREIFSTSAEGPHLRCLANLGDQLVVVEFKVDPLGGFELTLSPDFSLAVFPASSRGEHWRLFRWHECPHFVVEAGGAAWGGTDSPQSEE